MSLLDLSLAAAAASAALLWIGILLLPWRPWRTAETLESLPAAADAPLADVTALIPARNESAHIDATLRALRAQGSRLSMVVIDDQSDDATAEHVARYAAKGVNLVRGIPPPRGWTGKLWALEQGRRLADTPLLLLLDADIELGHGTIATMRQKLIDEELGIVSVLAALRMEAFWERLLMPAFVFFFKLLYPFKLANAPTSSVAAAAGGCLLLRTTALDSIGGFGRLRGELIDDCALAAHVKKAGHRTWIGLSRSVRSRRAYPRLGTVWNMVARTAFVQLRRSALWLMLCTVLMGAAFVAPLAGLLWWSAPAAAFSAAALAAMALCYAPVLRYYDRSPAWSLALPLIGALYLAMTWSSAIRYWSGRQTLWRGRLLARHRSDESTDLPHP